MGRTAGDDHRFGQHGPGGEPAPSEMWVTSAPADAGTGPGAPHDGGTAPDGPPGPGGTSPGAGRGHHGGPGRARWIGLAAGFAVLVAVIGVQHFAGGSRAAPTISATPSAPQVPSRTLAPPSSSAPPSRPPATWSTPVDVTTSAVVGASTLAGTLGYGGSRGITDSPTTPAPDTTSPVTSTVRAHVLPGEANWELVGYAPEGLVRYQPATGRVTLTPLPPLSDSGPVSFVVTRSAAIVAPGYSVGVQVPDGKPARVLPGLLGGGGSVLPGPGDDQVWATGPFDGTQVSLVLVDQAGKPTSTAIRIPVALSQSGPYGLAPDGAGYVLATGVGGTYDVRPDGVKRVTHGAVLAVGPTAFLVYECDDTARCTTSVIDRATGKHRDLPQFAPSMGFPVLGVVSADGRYAAIPELASSAPDLVLIDLVTGAVRRPHVEVNLTMFNGDATTLLAFTPDGRYLLAALDSNIGVVPIDTRTAQALDPLPVPRMSAIAVRTEG